MSSMDSTKLSLAGVLVNFRNRIAVFRSLSRSQGLTPTLAGWALPYFSLQQAEGLRALNDQTVSTPRRCPEIMAGIAPAETPMQ